jgi:hypothetical protein
MDLKLRVNGAFELSETKKDRWMQYNWQKNRSETCDLTRSTIINARVGGNLSNVSEFKTVYKTKEDETCEGAGQCSDQAFATKFDCETAGKTWTEIQNAGSTNGTGTAAGAMDQSFQFKKQGLSDVFNRINFEKCANHDCAGELSSSP